MSTPLPPLSELEILARQAGVILRNGLGQHTTIQHKEQLINLVTEVDHLSERFLVEAIQRRYPSHRIVAEESGIQGREGENLWFIDPLDGTVNFAHGIPIFSVSIAFAQNGQVKLGVVYDPMQDECFSAQQGQGALLNGRPIHVSGASELQHSLLVTGFPYDIWSNPDNNLDHFAHFAVCTQGVRRLGSAALDLCYVAAGRFDGFWELRLNPWDLAAGGLIAAEAGARVTDLNGQPNYLTPPCSILAANPQLYPKMLHLLRDRTAC